VPPCSYTYTYYLWNACATAHMHACAGVGESWWWRGCVCVCVCETHTHTHTHQIYEIASTHKHGIIELSACRAQPPPDEGGQPQQGSSTNRYTGCVDNNPIQNTHTHTHTTNRHRQQQHMRASHTIICIYLCVLGHKITIHNLRPCHRRRRW
jgi:hypothetical protein